MQTRILVIDDEEGLRTVLVRLLDSRGFKALEARDGEEGINLARSERPDLVLCDLEMPNVNGYQVLATLQADPDLGATPVMFLTGFREPEQVRYGMNLGVDDYLTKPIEPDTLIQAIQARLARVRRLRTAPPAPRPVPSKLGSTDTILIKTATEQRLVKVNQVTHIMAYGEYSWVYWEKSRGAMLRKALKQWARELPPEQFIRVHRGAIINLAYLDRVEKEPSGRMQVRLREAAQPIPVSLRLAASLNRKLRDLQHADPAHGAPAAAN